MDIRFQANNTHLDSVEQFRKTDPHLKRLYSQPYIYRSPLIQDFPRNTPGIFNLGGGRQVGKTTLLKQWMEDLLQSNVNPEAICFFSGELIDNHQMLYRLVKEQLSIMPVNDLKFFILDEVTYIHDWDKAIKYLADTGELEKVILMLTGSDLVLMQEARKRFPGRRGIADQVDFHYYPLSFYECQALKNRLDNRSIDEVYKDFDEYLIHGGFLVAINDFMTHQCIKPATLTIYSDWIRGDVLKRNKQEHYLLEILDAILKHYMKQISWDNLAKSLTINHTQTIADYVALLESMDAVFIQHALSENTLRGAPKKRKKLMFADPFIYHAIKAWLYPVENPYQTQILGLFSNSETYANIVESCVATQFRRFFPTYYIKAEGEVDIAYIEQDRFWPIEIKWRNQLRPKDIKQVTKYDNSIIYTKSKTPSNILGIPTLPLPQALLEFSKTKSVNTKK